MISRRALCLWTLAAASSPAWGQLSKESGRCTEDAIAEQQTLAKDDKADDDLKFNLQEALYTDALKVSAMLKDPKHSTHPPAYLRNCLDRKKKLMALNLDRSSPMLKASFRMLVLLGQIEEFTGRKEQALLRYRAALAREKLHFPTLRRAYDLWTAKQLEDFIQADIRQLDNKKLNEFIEQSNDFAGPILSAPDAPKELKISVLEVRAGLLQQFQREPEAMKDYARVLDVDPNHKRSLRRLAEFERTRNRPAEMRKYLERLAPLDRKDLAVQLNLLALEYRDEDAQALLTSSQAIEKVHPGNAEVRAYRGYALYKMGRGTEGEKLVREALKKDPKNKVARSALSSLHRDRAEKLKEAGQPGGALAEFAEALKLNPDDLKLRERMALFIYDFRKGESFQPADVTMKDLDRALDLLDPIVKQDYVNQGTIQVYVASAARSSSPRRGSPLCERYERDYGSAPDVEFVLDCVSCHRDASKDAKARSLLEASLKMPKYKAGNDRLFDALKKL